MHNVWETDCGNILFSWAHSEICVKYETVLRLSLLIVYLLEISGKKISNDTFSISNQMNQTNFTCLLLIMNQIRKTSRMPYDSTSKSTSKIVQKVSCIILSIKIYKHQFSRFFVWKQSAFNQIYVSKTC